MKFYFLMLILITQTALGQSRYEDNEDPFKTEIDKNIFRTLLSLSTDNQFSIQINFEHQIYKSFTFFLKAGPAISRSKIFFPNDYGEYRFAFSAIASGELRYYFNLKRRIRLEKTTRNFSASYLSLEPFVTSKSLLIINNNGGEPKNANKGVYINLGFQKQVHKTYYHAFFGTRFGGKIYENSVDVSDIIHLGIGIGGIL